MEHYQTDSDAGGQSSVGVGQVENLSRLLHEIQPNWIADGYGLRGPQQPKTPEQAARPELMQFGQDSGRKGFETPGSGVGACAPTTPDPSGTFVWGSVDGTCQWIDTTDCST